ncbi:MAG: 30S ribosomal protein S9 [Ignavibacteriales bacterium]|nr:30S ribosomal protein S9 [Ignavibacteriales bacterium]
MKQSISVGRRKTSIARVYLTEGNGTIQVNDRPFEQFFPLETYQTAIKFPFVVTENEGKYNAYVNVRGGGTTGQAGAAQMAIARALVAIDEALRPKLRAHSLLTRDSRMVERKKYGQPGARKRFQFSKR